ncbi:AraC family transcriptional regulator [Kineothrix sp. MSJ-39]|uniref:AraC family transcriptional regulator n=1 Tax=Kineothrix sp. MSJ-39 TaxID=2841533 RepID=UPI001C11B8E1|nr:AraC family transcriptional regulator [Kineothrix sp. MSJ-39]MBU5429107.1 AraC family transcriptional regulator [Kineothrix sp. MSJ-39]
MEICPSTVLNSDASENVAYNNPDFPAYIKKGQLSSYPDFRAVSHWHDDLEFILILNGHMSYDVNGQKLSLQTGEGIFVNSHCFHYGYSDAHTECLFICILLSPKLLSVNTYFTENCLNPLLQNRNFPYQKLSPAVQWQNSVLQDLAMLYENNTDAIQPYIILEKTVHIFRLLFENMNFIPDYHKNTADILALTAMIGYVQKNYPGKILLKDISYAGNCCKTKCTSLFQKYLHTSPMLYLNRYRLEKSVFLLQNTTMSVTEIAYTCGFSNTSYFCEIFHKYYNTTPGKFTSQNK